MPVELLQKKQKYSPDEDIEFLAGAQGTPLILDSSFFVVLFPQDAHKPGCIRSAPEEVRRLVVKVAMI
jgi:YhcH/YjgK/YiaL family protein